MHRLRLQDGSLEKTCTHGSNTRRRTLDLDNQPHDWMFASPRSKGKSPYWPDMLLSRVVRPAVARAGIQKHVAWHTFRHSVSTMLIANGENVKVVQELMRHSNCRCTLEIYSQARLRQSATPNIGLLR